MTMPGSCSCVSSQMSAVSASASKSWVRSGAVTSTTRTPESGTMRCSMAGPSGSEDSQAMASSR